MNLSKRFEGVGGGTGVDEPLVCEDGFLTAVGWTAVSEDLRKPFTRGSVERIVIARECRGEQRWGMGAMVADA